MLGLQVNAPGFAAPSGDSNPWQCNGHLLPDFVESASDAGNRQEGTSYLYVGAHQLTSNYRAEATFTLPRSKQRRGFYGNAIRMGPMVEDYATAQLMLVRWKRFNFAEHVAVSWAFADGTVQFKDTNLVYPDDRPSHRLAIGVVGRTISLYVDGAVICTANSDHFVRANAAKYFQIRSETNEQGYTAGGTVRAIALKRDADRSPRPFSSACEFHGYGVSWLPLGGGAFRVGGAFYPNEATYFSGLAPGTKCTNVAR